MKHEPEFMDLYISRDGYMRVIIYDFRNTSNTVSVYNLIDGNFWGIDKETILNDFNYKGSFLKKGFWEKLKVCFRILIGEKL